MVELTTDFNPEPTKTTLWVGDDTGLLKKVSFQLKAQKQKEPKAKGLKDKKEVDSEEEFK
jgi:hypothetical protein